MSPPIMQPPPRVDFEEAFDLTRVRCEFSGVVWTNLMHEWDEWKLTLERVAAEHDVWLGVKCWYDAKLYDGSVIVQLQVEDRSLPEPHRTTVYDDYGDWPQHAIWRALHQAGLVLEPILPQ